MSKIGFWDSVFDDVGYYERHAINDNAESLSMMRDAQIAGDQFFANQTRKLFALDKAQSKELARLRVMVRVLTEAAIDLGFDRERLVAQMEDALDALESEKTMAEGSFNPDGSGPFRGDGSAPADEPKTTCERCAKAVLVRRTNITEHGTLCDRCFYP